MSELRKLALKICIGAREMAQQLRTLAALAEDTGSVPSTYMLAKQPSVTAVLASAGIAYMLCTFIHTEKTPIHIK